MVAVADRLLPAHGSSTKRARRLAVILDLVAERGSISLADLMATLGISAATGRRDLAELDGQGLLVRTHGGATVRDGQTELPVALRDTRFAEAKRKIARAMVARIPPDRYVVALSGGTSTAGVARELAGHRDITVVTNSLTIAGLLVGKRGVRVVMTGGFLRPQSLELVGALAEHTFNAVNVGTAILGADGISAASGVTTHDETEARTNQAMVAKAQRTVVVADGSKVGRIALAQMATIGQVAMLITDSSADASQNSIDCAGPASRSSSPTNPDRSSHFPGRRSRYCHGPLRSKIEVRLGASIRPPTGRCDPGFLERHHVPRSPVPNSAAARSGPRRDRRPALLPDRAQPTGDGRHVDAAGPLRAAGGRSSGSRRTCRPTRCGSATRAGTVKLGNLLTSTYSGTSFGGIRACGTVPDSEHYDGRRWTG